MKLNARASYSSLPAALCSWCLSWFQLARMISLNPPALRSSASRASASRVARLSAPPNASRAAPRASDDADRPSPRAFVRRASLDAPLGRLPKYSDGTRAAAPIEPRGRFPPAVTCAASARVLRPPKRPWRMDVARSRFASTYAPRRRFSPREASSSASSSPNASPSASGAEPSPSGFFAAVSAARRSPASSVGLWPSKRSEKISTSREESSTKGFLRASLAICASNRVTRRSSNASTSSSFIRALAWWLSPPSAPRFTPCDGSAARRRFRTRVRNSWMTFGSSSRMRIWLLSYRSSGPARRANNTGNRAALAPSMTSSAPFTHALCSMTFFAPVSAGRVRKTRSLTASSASASCWPSWYDTRSGRTSFLSTFQRWRRSVTGRSLDASRRRKRRRSCRVSEVERGSGGGGEGEASGGARARGRDGASGPSSLGTRRFEPRRSGTRGRRTLTLRVLDVDARGVRVGRGVLLPEGAREALQVRLVEALLRGVHRRRAPRSNMARSKHRQPRRSPRSAATSADRCVR